MISKNLSDVWYADNIGTKKRGGQNRYSDKAILICLQIRYLFGLKPRESRGFIDWIFEISRLSITSSDYTTLSRRSKSLNLQLIAGFKDIIVKAPSSCV